VVGWSVGWLAGWLAAAVCALAAVKHCVFELRAQRVVCFFTLVRPLP
jgi:hypothetical protein